MDDKNKYKSLARVIAEMNGANAGGRITGHDAGRVGRAAYSSLGGGHSVASSRIDRQEKDAARDAEESKKTAEDEIKKRQHDAKKRSHSGMVHAEAVVDPDHNTKEREKVVNVSRPDNEKPTSPKSKLAKTAEINTKIIEEPTMFSKNFGLSAALISAARSVMEKKEEQDTKASDAKKMVGGKTQVDVHPKINTNIKEEGLDEAPQSVIGAHHVAARQYHQQIEAARKKGKTPDINLINRYKFHMRQIARLKAGHMEEGINFSESDKNKDIDGKESGEKEEKDKTKKVKRLERMEEGLVGNQKNLDMAPPYGKLTKADFTALRSGKGKCNKCGKTDKCKCESVKEDTLSASELARLERIAASFNLESVDEATKKSTKVPMAPSTLSAPRSRGNDDEDRSGEGVKNDNADYTISDEKQAFLSTGKRVKINKQEVNRFPTIVNKKSEKEIYAEQAGGPENVMAQLHKVVSTQGRYPITHKDGKQTKITPQLAKHAIRTHNNLKDSDEKQHFADTIHKSHDSMKSALSSK